MGVQAIMYKGRYVDLVGKWWLNSEVMKRHPKRHIFFLSVKRKKTNFYDVHYAEADGFAEERIMHTSWIKTRIEKPEEDIGKLNREFIKNWFIQQG